MLSGGNSDHPIGGNNWCKTATVIIWMNSVMAPRSWLYSVFRNKTTFTWILYSICSSFHIHIPICLRVKIFHIYYAFETSPQKSFFYLACLAFPNIVTSYGFFNLWTPKCALVHLLAVTLLSFGIMSRRLRGHKSSSFYELFSPENLGVRCAQIWYSVAIPNR